MTRTKKTQPKKKKKLFSQKGSQKGSNKMSAKVKSNKKSLNSKATAFVTPVSLATSAKPAAKPLSAKLRSAKGLSPKGTSVKHKVSPKSTSNKKETVNQFTNDEGGGGEGGQVSTTDDQPALKNAYRKMYENRFSQQRIPACTPLLTVGSAIPFFALITVAFAAIGCIMWQLNSYAVEYTFDYTDCVNHLTHKPCQLEVSQFWSPVNGSSTTTTTTKTTTTTTTKIPSSSTSSPSNNSNHHHHHNNDTTVPHCHCHLFITLNHSIPWNVFIYYRIESLFQSYLPYSESIDEVQLNGHLNGSEEVCGAYFTRLNGTNTPIAPCGMIANSLFNDSIALYKIVEHPGRDHKYLLEVPLFSTGITWTPKYAVKNPPVMHSCPAGVSKLQCAFNGTASPPNWHRHIWELDPEDAENNGYKNERLLSWMRFAPFGVFRKLYGRVDHQQVKTVRNAYAAQYYFGKTLSNGTYLLNISYNYPVAGFGGRKAIIISNTTWMGGKSPFLAYLFIITSIVCLFILIIFYFIDRKFGKLSDEVYSFVRDKSTQRQRQADSDLLERVKKHSAK